MPVAANPLGGVHFTCSWSPTTAATFGMSSLSRHTLKQLKFVLPGALVTYLLDTLPHFWHLVVDDHAHSWAR